MSRGSVKMMSLRRVPLPHQGSAACRGFGELRPLASWPDFAGVRASASRSRASQVPPQVPGSSAPPSRGRQSNPRLFELLPPASSRSRSSSSSGSARRLSLFAEPARARRSALPQPRLQALARGAASGRSPRVRRRAALQNLQREADVVAALVVAGQRVEIPHLIAHILGDGRVKLGLQIES